MILLPVPNDLLKTVKRKIRNFSKILAKLKSDEFTTLQDKTTSMSVDNALNVSYVIPGTVCPKCKTKIDEYEQDPITMVFYTSSVDDHSKLLMLVKTICGYYGEN